MSAPSEADTRTVAALFGLECDVYMGTEDIARQALNVFRMKLLGARVIPVTSGSKTLKDATNEAIRDWVTNVRTTHYILGSVVGPHPYPMLVRDFQSVIGNEAKRQILKAEGKLPDCPNDLGRVKEIIDLIERGYIDQVLLSHDIGMKVMLTRFGGWGYAHLLREVVPLMHTYGVNDEHITTMMVDNPRRLLTMQ